MWRLGIADQLSCTSDLKIDSQLDRQLVLKGRSGRHNVSTLD